MVDAGAVAAAVEVLAAVVAVADSVAAEEEVSPAVAAAPVVRHVAVAADSQAAVVVMVAEVVVAAVVPAPRPIMLRDTPHRMAWLTVDRPIRLLTVIVPLIRPAVGITAIGMVIGRIPGAIARPVGIGAAAGVGVGDWALVLDSDPGWQSALRSVRPGDGVITPITIRTGCNRSAA